MRNNASSGPTHPSQRRMLTWPGMRRYARRYVAGRSTNIPGGRNPRGQTTLFARADGEGGWAWKKKKETVSCKYVA